MEVDILYRVPKDLCWKYVKEIAKPNSIGLIYYKACLDPFITNKTIWNTISKLTTEGFMVIECSPETIGNAISAINKIGWRYSTIPGIGKSTWAIFLFVYRADILKPKHGRWIRIDNWDDVAYLVVNLAKLEDIVMIIGDSTLLMIPTIKRLGRNIIAMGDDLIYCSIAANEGLCEKYLV